MSRKSTPTGLRAGTLRAVALLVGIYVVILLVVLLDAALFVPVILAVRSRVNFALLILTQFVAAGSVPGLLVIYYGVFTLKLAPDSRPAVEVTPEQAPRLWEAVREVAEAVGTRPPTTLRLLATASASVSEETRLFGFATGERRLNLGLPLLLGVSVDELRAVLAHEMGHYARGHTRLGARVYLGSVALHNACLGLSAVRESGSQRRSIRRLFRIQSLYALAAFGVLSAYSEFYDNVSYAARRRQELDADACAAENFGRRVTASALRSAHALPTAWDRFSIGCLEPMHRAGFVPDEPFAAFEAMLCDPDYRDVLAELRRNPPARPTSRLDSHPTLEQRLNVLRTRPVRRVTGRTMDNAPAIELFTDEERDCVSRALRREMFPTETEPDLGWQEWLGRAARLQATAPAKSLVRAAGKLTDVQAVTLCTVLDLLEAGCGHRLVELLASDHSETRPSGAAADETVLATAVLALIGHYLTEAGRAWWATQWNGPSRLIAADSAAEELPGLISAAIDHPATEVPRLRLHLASLGLDPAAETPATALLRSPNQAAATAGAAGTAQGPGATTGVSIKPLLDEAALRRQETIRAVTVVVAVVTGVIGIVGVYRSNETPAYNSSNSLYNSNDPGGTDRTPPTYKPYTLPTTNPYLTYGAIPRFIWPSFPVSTRIVVKQGDSLSLLACRYRTTVTELQAVNFLETTRIDVGQHLTVPVIAHPATDC
ncbi:Zn-dependent protease with chaperone function [Kitasatospora sp. MAP12-15]|uniref:M48 family metalloprotease n=1 Tax=unclassified Kitasatospora TaxID=2633591 RepID=UPI0024739B94|nr:M48 family metalloprotease [Kitasatospora sp. MAP12-44]MDH6107829.1 Zn-dependent protease with chaperone function [Kitasatospora sp. MAP12-44]